MSISDQHWAEGNWSPASGESAFHQLLDQYPKMDAVFAANDQMALSVVHVVCQRGLSIPRDLAIVGFDGIPESAYFWPPLTTVHQDLHELGCTTVQQVVRLIEAHQRSEDLHHPETTWLKPRLIVRESSLAITQPVKA